MYISDVSGHRSAAEAIEKEIKRLEPDSEILNINAFRYTNPISEKVINSIYMGVIKKAPQVWDYLYDNPRVVKRLEKIKEAIHKTNSIKLKTLFDKFRPDAVICTQAFPCGMVADYKEIYRSNILLMAVLTDYAPHAYWVYDTVDYYITPCQDVSGRLTEKGVAPEKIKPFGIPFDSKFNAEVKKEAVIKKLKLNPDLPTILIMGGGHGLGPIKTIVKSLETVKQGFQEVIVAGANKKLYNSLKRKIKKYKKNILLFGFVDDIHELMSIADIIITKPGGITTAEALAKGLPMVIVHPIPGQEVSNTNYLIEKGAAVKIDKAEEISSVIEDFLVHPHKLRQFSGAALGISKPNASVDVAKLILNV